MERDICGLVLSVNVQVNSPFVDETGTDRAPFVMQQNPSAVSPVMATRPPIDDTPGLPAVEEVDRVCLGNVEARAEIQIKSVLPELLRLEEIFMRCEEHHQVYLGRESRVLRTLCPRLVKSFIQVSPSGVYFMASPGATTTPVTKKRATSCALDGRGG